MEASARAPTKTLDTRLRAASLPSLLIYNTVIADGIWSSVAPDHVERRALGVFFCFFTIWLPETLSQPDCNWQDLTAPLWSCQFRCCRRGRKQTRCKFITSGSFQMLHHPFLSFFGSHRCLCLSPPLLNITASSLTSLSVSRAPFPPLCNLP